MVGNTILRIVICPNFSLRSPVPIWSLLIWSRSLLFCPSINSYNLLLKILMALALFLCCDFSSRHFTTNPEGMCVILTAELVLLTFCPPGPEARKVSTTISLGFMSISTSSISGRIATVAAEVCTRPLASVRGTL